MEIDKIYNEDCMVGMERIPDGSIDLVATDCPYRIVSGGDTQFAFQGASGILNRTKTNPDLLTGKMFRYNDIPFEQWLPVVYRKLRPQAHCYIMVNSRNLRELWEKAEDTGFRFQNLLIWDKGNATPNKWYMQAFECILFLRKGAAFNINEMGTTIILRVQNPRGGKFHPTQKPVELIEWLVKSYTNEGETVLDNCMGSGTTAIACINTNRHFIGFELNKEYFDRAIEPKIQASTFDKDDPDYACYDSFHSDSNFLLRWIMYGADRISNHPNILERVMKLKKDSRVVFPDEVIERFNQE